MFKKKYIVVALLNLYHIEIPDKSLKLSRASLFEAVFN